MKKMQAIKIKSPASPATGKPKAKRKVARRGKKKGGAPGCPGSAAQPREFTAAEEAMFYQYYEENFGWGLGAAIRYGLFDPESVVSEALRKAMIRFDPKVGKFTAFFGHILFCDLDREYCQKCASRGLFAPMPEGFEPVDHAALEYARRRELRDLLQVAVAQLSPQDQHLYHLMYERELSLDEIAALL
jgi:DNA-directed RNA polymerase specialized sigma24 family protein